MKMELERFASDRDTTMGAIRIEDRFVCFTLEDEYRTEKVAAETRIPAGTYTIKLRTEGGMTQRYQSKFPGLHRGMLWLQDVPGFEWIYIHIGNTEEHTEGCILVGRGATAKRDDMSLQFSTDAYRALYTQVAKAATRDDLSITILDRDQVDVDLLTVT